MEKTAENTKKQKQDDKKYYAKRFTLVVHGQKQEDLDNLVKFFDTDEVTLAVIAKEFGKHKVHPHWQIYFELKERKSMKNRIFYILNSANFHLEKAIRTQDANIKYVFAINKEHELGLVVYCKNVNTPADYYKKEKAISFWNNFQPRPFQQKIIDIVNSEPDRRNIYYFYEYEGNTGKTMIAEYLHMFHGAIITGGKSSDMKHAIVRWKEIVGHMPICIIVDLARSDKLNAESAKAIESMKNGLFFSGKYESAMVHSTIKPHIFIFANVPLEKEFFSKDRLQIAKIINHDLDWEK